MANEKADKGLDNRGQQKTHTVFDALGNPVEMTQEEWRNRDKDAGFTRPDDEVEDDDDVAEEAPAEGAESVTETTDE